MRKAYEDRLKLLIAEQAESQVSYLKTTMLSGIDQGVYGVIMSLGGDPVRSLELLPFSYALVGGRGTSYPNAPVMSGYWSTPSHDMNTRATVLYKPLQAEEWADWPVHYDTSLYKDKWILLEDFTPGYDSAFGIQYASGHIALIGDDAPTPFEVKTWTPMQGYDYRDIMVKPTDYHMPAPSGQTWSLDGTPHDNNERVSTTVGSHTVSFTAYENLTHLQDETVVLSSKMETDLVRQAVISGFASSPMMSPYSFTIPTKLRVHRWAGLYGGEADENGDYDLLSGTTLEDVVYKHNSKEYYIMKVTAECQPYSNSMWILCHRPDGGWIEDCLIAPPGKMPDDADSLNGYYLWQVGHMYYNSALSWQHTDRWNSTPENYDDITVTRL